MELETTSMSGSSTSNLICRICGDIARGYNFDVITCMSCKSFFRRNALRLPKIRRYPCRNHCNITKETRTDCPACRLRKCFAYGMNPKLIRAIDQDKLDLHLSKQLQLPAPKPLNLLRHDSSNLTSDQWNLLSNIIRSYDEQNIINQVKIILKQKSSLPPKLRLKPEDTINLNGLSIQGIVPLVERSPHLRSLSYHASRALALHNVFLTGGLSGYLVARDTDAFRNPIYMAACSIIHESDFMMGCAQDNARLVQNGNLVKLMLFVLIFSSSCSVVVFNNEEDLETMSSSMELVNVQNIYVTMLWKYLVYLYGENGAVIHYSTLVKNVTDMLARTAEAIEHIGRKVLTDRVITQTKRSLCISD